MDRSGHSQVPSLPSFATQNSKVGFLLSALRAVVVDVEGMGSEPDALTIAAWRAGSDELHGLSQRLAAALCELREHPPSPRASIVWSAKAMSVAEQRREMEAALVTHIDEYVRVRGALRTACKEGEAVAQRAAELTPAETWSPALQHAGFGSEVRLRDTQLLPLQLIAAGHDGIVALPTGAGKSLIMELPALTNEAMADGRVAVVFVPFRQCGEA